MDRKIEKRLVTLLGIWQIIDGVITIFAYGFFKYGPAANKFGANVAQTTAENAINGSFFTLVCTFGTLLIILGIANLMIARRYLKPGVTAAKFGWIMLAQGLFSYFILDIPGIILGFSAGVVYFAKSKARKNLLKKQATQ